MLSFASNCCHRPQNLLMTSVPCTTIPLISAAKYVCRTLFHIFSILYNIVSYFFHSLCYMRCYTMMSKPCYSFQETVLSCEILIWF